MVKICISFEAYQWHVKIILIQLYSFRSSTNEIKVKYLVSLNINILHTCAWVYKSKSVKINITNYMEREAIIQKLKSEVMQKLSD